MSAKMKDAIDVTLGVSSLRPAPEQLEALKRQARNGTLFGEYGSPQREALHSDKQWLNRQILVDDTKVSHQIVDISQDKDGRLSAKVVIADTPHGQRVKEQLERADDAQLQFAMRGLGKFGEHPDQVITYDLIAVSKPRSTK